MALLQRFLDCNTYAINDMLSTDDDIDSIRLIKLAFLSGLKEGFLSAGDKDLYLTVEQELNNHEGYFL